MRRYSALESVTIELDRALRTLAAPDSIQNRELPGSAPVRPVLNERERKHAAGLMRINHAGEVAAQALYFGHAAQARAPETRALMLNAAREEGDHLAWCAQRLKSLGSQPSLFGPVWYGGAYALGALSARVSDRFALGFVAETEAQVEAHLLDHQTRLPEADLRSREVLAQMRGDEIAHGAQASAAGAQKLPWPVPSLMRKAADVMRAVAYRI